mmetsp:Transcript_118666/g.236379  ORF Transcript_118666/g.236379 Transcript_118666/m.236379 type:complete len:98 (-) Transcript_118666:46-339(-)
MYLVRAYLQPNGGERPEPSMSQSCGAAIISVESSGPSEQIAPWFYHTTTWACHVLMERIFVRHSSRTATTHLLVNQNPSSSGQAPSCSHVAQFRGLT